MTPSAAGPAEPGALRRTVLTTWRAVQLARLAESVLLGAAALGLGLSAAVVSGTPGDSVSTDGPVASWPDAWGAALVCAFACALTWWFEHRSGPADVAARIDGKLRLRGALVTAFELEHRGTSLSAVARLLVERTARRTTRRDSLRVALPRSGPFLAPPLIAAALLAATLEATREPPPAVPVAALLAGLARQATDLGTRAAEDLRSGELTPGEVREALELAARAGRLELRAREDGVPPAAIAEAARDLQAELAELLARIPPDTETARAAERAAGWADLAAAGSASRGEAGQQGEGTPSADFEGSPKPEVAAGAGDGTMSGSPSPAPSVGGAPDGSTDPLRPPQAPEAERGVAAGRWWPARYDDVVERWVEARRARARSESP